MGLINWLGTFERDNTEWSGYKHAPELSDQVGKAGVSMVDIPRWIPIDRPFAVGNTVFTPQSITDPGKKTMEVPIDTEGNREIISGGPEYFSENVIREEIPHVAQWRDEGILGFLGKQLSDILQHGKKSYITPGSHEGFHHVDPEEKERLTERILGEDYRLEDALAELNKTHEYLKHSLIKKELFKKYGNLPTTTGEK